MKSNLRTICEQYLEAAQIAARARSEMCRAIQRKSDMLRADEATRRTELKRDQREFYLAIIKNGLASDLETNGALNRAELEVAAESIINKLGYIKGRNSDVEGRRTRREHQHHNNAKVQWCLLLREAGVPAIDSRGG